MRTKPQKGKDSTEKDHDAAPWTSIDRLVSVTKRLEADVDHVLELEAALAERDVLRNLINRVPDQLFIKDTSCRFVVANEAVVADKRFLNGDPVTVDSIIGKGDFDMFPPHVATKFRDAELEIMRSGTSVTADMRDRRTYGGGWSRWVSMTKVPLINRKNEVVGLLGVGRDVTARKQAEARFHHQAHHDSLTGLANRDLFAQKLKLAIEASGDSDRRVVVLFIDLDKFKLVNDGLGHHVGDVLLQTVAQRLNSTISTGDTAARLGGDEFVLLLNNAESNAALQQTIERVKAAIAEPLLVRGHHFSITASIGIASYPEQGDSAESILRNADAAMYQAKQLGRDNYQLYSQSMNTSALERINIIEALRHAIARNEFRLHFQPLVSLNSRTVFGVEALLRWTNPIHGAVSPAQFIPLAEETGLIVPIGEWVLEKACEQNAKWQATGRSPINVSVNVSARQFVDAGFIMSIQRALDRSGLMPANLELELTESMIMHDLPSAMSKMNKLNELGVNLSIDDFGTGYSSLSALKRFPIGRLKIDRTFVQGVSSDEGDRAITAAIISLAQKLHLRVLAEGVETREQLDFLIANGCDEAQGHYFSEALPEDEFQAWSVHYATFGPGTGS